MPIDSSVWGTETGLLDDFDYTVREVWFGPNPESEFPEINYLHFRGPALVGGEVTDENFTIRYSTGQHWEVVKSGAEVESATGALKFNARSGCGELVTRALKLANEDPALMKAMETRGRPTEAATWKDLSFHMELVTETFRDRNTGEERTYYRQLPVAYLGSGAPAKGKAPREAKEAKPAKADASLRRSVVKFARGFDEDEFDEFVDAVLDPDEFARAGEIGDALKAEILDEGGIWAEAHE